MSAKFINWLFYTCLLGLLPVLARLFVWALSANGVDPFAVADLVTYGLVLHIVGLNELTRAENRETDTFTALHAGSLFLIVIYAMLLFAVIAEPPTLNKAALLPTTAFLCVVSTYMSRSIAKDVELVSEAE